MDACAVIPNKAAKFVMQLEAAIVIQLLSGDIFHLLDVILKRNAVLVAYVCGALTMYTIRNILNFIIDFPVLEIN